MTQIASPFPPDFRATLDAFKAEVFRDLNCHQLGQIVTYSTAGGTRKASVKILSQRVTPDGKYLDYPLLTDCPVFMPRGGEFGINLPVEAGDPCLVLFNDTDIDQWFANASAGVPNTDRQHSLSDGMVLVGLGTQVAGSYSSAEAIFYGPKGYISLAKNGLITLTTVDGTFSTITLATSGQINISNGGTNIKVNASGKVSIYNGSENLKDVLDALCTALTSWVNTGGSTPNAATVTAINAVKTSFDNLLV